MEDSIIVNLSVQVHIPTESWIDFCLLHPDIFSPDYIGYWAYGVRPDNIKNQWIVIEESEMVSDVHMKTLVTATNRAILENKRLPKPCHLLNKETVIKAFLIGCEKWGVDWFETADGNNYDIVIQNALLGETRYG